MYSDVFCKVYNELGWNVYPEVFGGQLLTWLDRRGVRPKNSMDLGCGTGVLCEILHGSGVEAAGMDYSTGMIDIARKSNPGIDYQVADMRTFRPEQQYDLITCTGDALNHIGDLDDIAGIFHNVYSFTRKGGYFIFDMLNEHEVSTGEPFELEFSPTIRVLFQMTRPGKDQVNLNIRVFEDGMLTLEENIRERVYAPEAICALLRDYGFEIIQCADRLLEDANPGTTWFVVARKN